MSQQIGYQKAYKHLQEVSKINNTTQGKGKEITLHQSQRQ